MESPTDHGTASQPGPYSDNQEHLTAELRRVSALLTLSVHKHLASSPANARKLVGAHLDENDIRRLLQGACDPDASFVAPQAMDVELREEIARARTRDELSDARRKASRAAEFPLLLDRFYLTADVAPMERDIILLLLLAEVDPNAGLLFAYLNDDLVRRFPTVHSVCVTLAPSYAESFRMHRIFAPEGSLTSRGVIWTTDDEQPLASRRVRLSHVAAHYLLEQPGLPDNLRALMDAVSPVALERASIPAMDCERLRTLCNRYINGSRNASKSGRPGIFVLLALEGLDGADHRLVARGLAHHMRVPLFAIRLSCVLADPEPVRLLREAILLIRLNRCVLFVEGMERFGNSSSIALHEWEKILSCAAGFVVFDGDPASASDELRASIISIQLSRRESGSRLQLWKDAVGDLKLADDVDLAALAGSFRLNAQQISASVAWCRSAGLLHSGEDGILSQRGLQASCRRHTDRTLLELGSRIEARRSWDDLILPLDQVTQLREMCLRLKHHFIVYESWGLGRRVTSGRGVNALFAGPSGTGKTMAAEIVAHDLGQDAYRIDLSSMVSKYIGETEKNLSKVFDAAERSNAVLFFDEADALFGKRSDVKDAHDRYANIQVAYLLQRIEAYCGVAILATNLKANTDEAFIRRLDFLVEFPFPEAEDRARIWRKFLASPLPSGQVEIDTLAEKFRITGGVIKNAVIQAAFLAAEEGTVIETRHLLGALRREYQKMGRLTSEIEEFSRVGGRANPPKPRRNMVPGAKDQLHA